MAIEAQLPDGTTLQFPDGTPPAIVDGAVKQHVSSLPGGAVETRESRLGLKPAPPEPSKPAQTQDEYSGAPTDPGFGIPTGPAWQSPIGIDTSIQPGPNVGSIVPFSRDPSTGRMSLALPNAARAILTEGPQGYVGPDRFETPAATIDPATGNLGVTPEAQTAAGFVSPSGLRFGGRLPARAPEPPPPAAYPAPAQGPVPPPFIPPGMPAPSLNRLMDLIRADEAMRANKPAFVPPTTSTSVTGEVTPIQQPRNPLGPEQRPVQPSAPPVEPPTPGPAGAQVTPPGAAGLTPEQSAAAGSTADKQWLYKTVTPGETNDVEYVKGINPTMAQREQTVNAAREAKDLRNLSPEADQNERELLSHHADLRKGEFQEIAGSDVTQQADMKAANDQIEAGLQAAYSHGGTVDLQPVIDAANAELTGSAGKLPPLRAAMKEIADAAQKSDGSGLETNPLQANAVRRAIIYMQSKAGRQENPGYGAPDVMAALTRVKDVLTKQIEPAAPGFTEANANYAKARQAIDAREALQEYEPKLYGGPFGHMQFSPFHRMMSDIIASRDPNAPLNPYKALTEEQMNRLKSLHDDLQRVATAQDLAKAAGSDTAQNLAGMARRAIQGGVGGLAGYGAGLIASHIIPGAGIPVGMFTQRVVDKLFSDRAVRQATAEHNRLLRPDVTQFPLKPNPLMQPPL